MPTKLAPESYLQKC